MYESSGWLRNSEWIKWTERIWMNINNPLFITTDISFEVYSIIFMTTDVAWRADNIIQKKNRQTVGIKSKKKNESNRFGQ